MIRSLLSFDNRSAPNIAQAFWNISTHQLELYDEQFRRWFVQAELGTAGFHWNELLAVAIRNSPSNRTIFEASFGALLQASDDVAHGRKDIVRCLLNFSGEEAEIRIAEVSILLCANRIMWLVAEKTNP